MNIEEWRAVHRSLMPTDNFFYNWARFNWTFFLTIDHTYLWRLSRRIPAVKAFLWALFNNKNKENLGLTIHSPVTFWSKKCKAQCEWSVSTGDEDNIFRALTTVYRSLTSFWRHNLCYCSLICVFFRQIFGKHDIAICPVFFSVM